MEDFNPFDPATRANPYPAYARLREEAPVYQVPGVGAYAIARYEDVSQVLMHPEIFSSLGMGTTDIRGVETRMMIGTDPPDHTRLRSLINRSFTPRMVADLEPHIREVTARFLKDALPGGRMDLIADLAMPLPVTIIAELLGVDPERRDDFKRWSDRTLSDDYESMTPEEQQERDRDMDTFISYFEDAVAQRKQHPTNDLIGLLARAESEEQALSFPELIAFIGLLLIAGNETTTNLIGNAMIALVQHPDQIERVRSQPDLIPNMIEEALRYDAPVQYLFRSTTCEVVVSGTTIPEGAAVLPLFGSANRDERRYSRGEEFDITRDAQGHLAFGHGIHFCLGAPLARLEARVAFEMLLPAIDSVTLDIEGIEYVESTFLRGPKQLPLTFTPTVEPEQARSWPWKVSRSGPRDRRTPNESPNSSAVSPGRKRSLSRDATRGRASSGWGWCGCPAGDRAGARAPWRN
jgi:cytochrome P450